jgi:uncharacterized protein YlxW (UPF0749 family)
MRALARVRREHLAVGVVLAILGILVIGQLRGQSGSDALAELSAQELTVLVANLNDQNERLRDEVATIERQKEALTTTKGRGDSALDQLRADLGRIRGWSGVTGLVGPGISVTVRGPIGGDGVEDLLNELRNAGAEAIVIGDVRLVPGIVVTGAAGAVVLGDTPLGEAFEIRAIGSPQILTGTLTRSGGIIAQLATAYPDVNVSVTPLEEVSIAPTERNLTPAHGRPVL